MKKTLIALFSVVTLILTLTACGGNTPPAGGGMTKAAWDNLFEDENFADCTMTVSIVQDEGPQNHMVFSATVKIDGTVNGDKKIVIDQSSQLGTMQPYKERMAFEEKGDVLYKEDGTLASAEDEAGVERYCHDLFDFDDYFASFTQNGNTFTAESCGFAIEAYSSFWTEQRTTDVEVTLVNGKLATVSYVINYVYPEDELHPNGTYRVSYTFSDYGTTVIE